MYCLSRCVCGSVCASACACVLSAYHLTIPSKPCLSISRLHCTNPVPTRELYSYIPTGRLEWGLYSLTQEVFAECLLGAKHSSNRWG